MKIRTETDASCDGEIVIRVPAMTDGVFALQQAIGRLLAESGEITASDGVKEVYLPVRDLLFFEMYDGAVYVHTAKSCYRCDGTLLRWQERLPRTFTRASKATLINTARIMSLSRSLTGVGEAEFYGTDKKCAVSRLYYHEVRDIIEETRLKR